MGEPVFKKEDVWAVARALGQGVYVDETASMNSYRRCRYCSAWEYHDWQEPEGWQDTFKHDSYCPTLIARDLLTGAAHDD